MPRAEHLESRTLFAGVPVATGVPPLHSFPGAPANILLDFNVTASITTSVFVERHPYDLDGDDTTFNPFEQQVMREVWSHVADAFAPFNVNVTTVDPGPDNVAGKTLNLFIGGPQNGGPRGYSGGRFYSPGQNYAVVKNLLPELTGIVAVHEAGHVLGLLHQASYDADGNQTSEYRTETGPVGPIMGLGGASRNLWSDGPSHFLSTDLQDDMAIIAGRRNDFGYRPDDHADTASGSSSIPLSGANGGSASGILHYHTDVDWFTFNWPGGPLAITTEGSPHGPQLDPSLELSNASGAVVATAVGPQVWKMIRADVPAGTYRLRVASTPYTDSLGTRAYGNVGQYTLRILPGARAEPQVPYHLQPFAITAAGPTTIEAEDFDRGGEGVSYQTAAHGYQHNQHRANEGVLTYFHPFEGFAIGGGGIAAGDWIEYSINVQAAGTYDLSARVHGYADGGRLHAEIDGVPVTTSVPIPHTGDFNTIDLARVNLTAGTHVLRVVADTNASGNPFTGDVNWLRFTPVTSTPGTPVALRAVADAYVRDGSSAGLNFGTSAELQLKKNSTGSNREVYLKFDVGGVSSVSSAKLRLFGRIDSSTERPSVAVFSATNTSWAETAINWNNRPPAGTTALATATVSTSTQKWYEWDVTGFLQAQKAAGATSVTLVVRSLTTTTPHMIFASDEAAANRPELLVNASTTPPPPQVPVTLRSAADAHVRDGSSAGLNFGSSTELQLKKSGTGSNREIYFKFDLSTLTTVSSAKLRVFGRIDSSTERPSVGVFAASNTSWAENTLTWNNRPPAGTTALATATVATSTAKWYEWDVTAYLQSQKAAGAQFVTLVLRSLTTTTPHMIFSSDEAAANRPELVVSA